MGEVSLYGILEDAQTGVALAADVVDLSSQSGVVFMRATPPVRFAQTQAGAGRGRQPLAGSVYFPIPSGAGRAIPTPSIPELGTAARHASVDSAGGAVSSN